METKKYRANDMQEALSQINSELGPDAIIISSKLVRQNGGIRGLFEKKVYEVVAAYEVPVNRTVKVPDTRPKPAKSATHRAEPLRTATGTQSEETSAYRTPGFERYIKNSLSDITDDRRAAVESARRDFAVVHPGNGSSAQMAAKSVKVELTGIPDSLQLPNIKPEKEPAPRIVAVSEPAKQPEPPAAEPPKAVLAKNVSNTLSTVKVSIPTLVEEEHHVVPDEHDSQQKKNDTAAVANAKGMSQEVIEEKIEELKDMLQKVTDRFEYVRLDLKNGYTPRVEKLVATLITNGVNVDIAHEMARKTQQSVDQIQANPQNMIRKLLKTVLGDPSFIRCERGRRRSVMFIGPTGVGKTTTLAKLAAYYAIKLNMNVGIINSDVFRMAATEQLNAYAEIMNIANITIHNSEDMKNALDQFRDKDIVFIDTSGKLASDGVYQRDIKTMIDVGEIDEIYLCMCSTTSDRVCKEIINHYRFVEDYKVIVTKIDENVCFGNIVNIARYSGKPLSYLTNGQHVPDDIMQIDIDEMVEKVMR